MFDILVYGVLRGAIFAMAAFGFSLVLGVLEIVNIAHGVYIIIGGFFTYWLATQQGLPLPAAMLVAAILTGVIAALLQRIFIERVFKANPLMVLVQTFGLAIVMTQILEKTFGASERLMRFSVPKYPVVDFLGVLIPTNEAVVFGIALLSTLALLLLLNFTDFGRAIRACRDNPKSAAILGINVNSVYTKTMFICGLWTGLAGALLIGIQPLAPYMYMHWTIDAFLIVIIGGLSSIPGVLIAGFLYGVVNYTAYYYLSTLAPAIIYGSLVIVLLCRPQGLFGLGVVNRK